MRILAIETSCDETSLALVEAAGGLRNPQFEIKKHLIASQIEVHRPWGGVVPNLAKREHQTALPIIFSKIIGRNVQFPISNFQTNSKFKTQKIDLIAVTVGPGLEPALWQGIEFAKELAKRYTLNPKRLIGTNHLHGHMYAFLLQQKRISKSESLISKNIFPAIQLIASGGHTILLLMKSLTEYKKIGETKDDAAGEAFDKVARMLSLPYPGGPEIEKIIKNLSPEQRRRASKAIDFPRPMIHEKNYDFSFSGLKTAVLYYLRDTKKSRIHTNDTNTNSRNSHEFALSLRRKADVAASFQAAAIDVLVTKTIRAAKEHEAKSIILSGGVASNQALRNTLRTTSKKNGLNFLSADKKFQGDNAAMIAVAAYINKKKYPLRAAGRLDI